MSNKTIKTGSCSVVLGDFHYKDFLTIKDDKLIKIVKSNNLHNEFKNLGMVRRIPNYESFYSIPDELSYLLKKDSKFYEYVKTLALLEDPKMSIFTGDLSCHFLDNAGDYDLLESINNIEGGNFTVWKSYKSIANFAKQILTALSFLHNNKIAHLDIKPENIMVDEVNKRFKIIDFGFSDVEPFTSFLTNLCGTPGYFPQNFDFDKPTPWLPKIKANDMTPVMGGLRMTNNHTFVYKIDTFSFGRVLYFLRYIYDSNYQPSCCCFDSSSRMKVNNLIKSLLEEDVRLRPYITSLVESF